MSFKDLGKLTRAGPDISEPSETACPGCLKERSPESCSILKTTIEELFQPNGVGVGLFCNSSPEYAFWAIQRSEGRWACDVCLNSKVALRANPKHQDFCDYPPYLAYTDQVVSCRTCQGDFTFSKEEQRHWYEEIGFLVQSRAVNCISCRADARTKKVESQKTLEEIETLLLNLDTENLSQISLLVGLYEKLGARKRVEHYQKTLQRLERACEQRDKITQK